MRGQKQTSLIFTRQLPTGLIEHEMIADKDEVLAAINTARAAYSMPTHSFYTGESDVPYAKQGHIPVLLAYHST